MSLKGLRFTLDVDGLGQKTFAVVNFVLRQRHTFPFVLDIDVASDSFGETAEKLLEKNATLTIWQGNTPQRYVSGIVIACCWSYTMYKSAGIRSSNGRNTTPGQFICA